MVYQEDVTRVAMALAGFSLADAEGLRKVVSKKHRRGKLDDYRVRFHEGARRNGVSDRVIEQVWEMVMAFAGYSFCKPHSASYVQVSFQSAWLKVHFPAAFMAGVISNFGGFYSTQAYVSEAQRLGLSVVAPDVNDSGVKCRSRGSELVIGLHLVAGLGGGAAERIESERQAGGVYRSLEDFVRRARLDESHAERCIMAGACDSLEPDGNRSRLFWRLRSHFKGGGTAAVAPSLRPYSPEQFLACQYRTLGFLVARHPLTLVRPSPAPGTILIHSLRLYVGRRVSFYGWCVTSRSLTTGGGDGMQFVTFEDETGIVETVLFPEAYERFASCLAHQEAFLVSGRVTEDFGALAVEITTLCPLANRLMNTGEDISIID
jgi:DNA polymerase III alpha subunit